MRCDTEYNAINSYFMLHVNYRFNLFGTKDARRHERSRRFGQRPGFYLGRPPRGGLRPGDPEAERMVVSFDKQGS